MIKNVTKRENNPTSLLDILGGSTRQDERIFVKAASNLYEFYLSGYIEDASEYIAWYDIIRNAGENDVIKIYINSYGGDMFSALQFVRVMQESQATIAVSVEGACMSAATLVFMMGNVFQVSDHSMFMFHNYSGGTTGKGAEMLDQLQHEKLWSEKIFKDIYKDFLTEKEINEMLNNKDIWMDGQEVVRRLNKKSKKTEKEQISQ